MHDVENYRVFAGRAMNNELNKLYAQWLEEFQGESDRACAVLAAAFLDQLLEKLLRAFFIDNKKVISKLLYDQRPLGNFSSRIHAAFALDLIADVEYRDLHLIRKIRNDFAHQLVGLSFKSSKIENRCLELQIINEIHYT